MASPDPNLLVVYGYKALVVLIGFACVCLGLWLSFRRVNTRVGDVEASAGKLFGLKITQPTAAALLIVAGAVIIVYGVTRPFSYDAGGIDSRVVPQAATGDSTTPATAAPTDSQSGGTGVHISDTATATPANPRAEVAAPKIHITDTM